MCATRNSRIVNLGRVSQQPIDVRGFLLFGLLVHQQVAEATHPVLRLGLSFLSLKQQVRIDYIVYPPVGRTGGKTAHGSGVRGRVFRTYHRLSSGNGTVSVVDTDD